jgi:hypothetical protein
MGKDLCMSSIVCPARRRDAESSNSHFNREKRKRKLKIFHDMECKYNTEVCVRAKLGNLQMLIHS